jgi:hypothetical protein
MGRLARACSRWAANAWHEEVESVVEGLGVDVRDFDDAAHGHLVDQQFENGRVLVMFPLPCCGLGVL